MIGRPLKAMSSKERLTLEKFITTENMSAFTLALHGISEECIPKSSTSSNRRYPWFSDEYKTELTNAYRRYENSILIHIGTNSIIARIDPFDRPTDIYTVNSRAGPGKE